MKNIEIETDRSTSPGGYVGSTPGSVIVGGSGGSVVVGSSVSGVGFVVVSTTFSVEGVSVVGGCVVVI